MRNFLTIFFLITILGIAFSVNVHHHSTSSSSSETNQLGDVTTNVTALWNEVRNINKSLIGLQSFVASFPQLRVVNGGVNLFNYAYRDCKIYQNIFEAYNLKVFEKVGSPPGWDETSYATAKYGGQRNGIRIGNGVSPIGTGIVVNVPAGYDVIWLRVFNDDWATFRINPEVLGNDRVVETYACGFRSIVEYSPDGGPLDTQQRLHVWCPMPIRVAGRHVISSAQNGNDWISGIAFGKNIWNHAKNSAVAYHWKLNSGSDVEWDNPNWNNDVLARIPVGKITDMYVPVLQNPRGGNKMIYIIEHNNNWVGVDHGAVRINDQSVERFRTTYSNPFATNANSKMYSRYIATYFPSSLIQPGDEFVKLTIDLTNSDNHIYFREIGTHDYF